MVGEVKDLNDFHGHIVRVVDRSGLLWGCAPPEVVVGSDRVR